MIRSNLAAHQRKGNLVFIVTVFKFVIYVV